MTEGISIKTTTIRPGARSRGRDASSTRTFLRDVRADAHPAEIMSVMSGLFMLIEHLPASYIAHGVRYELLRVERRTVCGVRVSRAVFKDEGAVRKSFAREMRRRHRASCRSHLRAGRADARFRSERAAALLSMARSAKTTRSAQNAIAARAPMPALSPLYPSAPKPASIQAIPSG